MTIAAATPKPNAPTPANLTQLKARAQALRLMGLLAHWDRRAQRRRAPGLDGRSGGLGGD
jgi:hypothetical protein